MMMKQVLAAAGILAVGIQARGADWPKIEGLNFTSRLSVTVENPSDAALDAALVHLPYSQLTTALPDAKPGQIAVYDPAAPAPKRDAADKYFVPFQENDGGLIFSVPLKPHESKQVYLYTLPEHLNMPGFAMGTGYDSRHAYRSFENNLAAFRMETGPGANTTGLAIDLFGKTAAGKGLRLAELYQQGHDAYHELQYWGVDILKVGTGPGLGGIYLIAGDQTGRATYQTTTVDCVYAGPVETRLLVTAPVEVGGKKYKVTRTLTLVADDRSIRDEVVVTGDDITGLQIGLGVRDLPNCSWTEDPKTGTAFMTGDANQAHYKAVGLGVLFNPDEYVRTYELPADPINGGHVYVLKGHSEDGKFVSRHRLADIWDADGQLPKPVDTAKELNAPFAAWFQAWAAERDKPISVKVADKAESAG